MTALFGIFFFVLLLLTCGFGVVRMLDPTAPSARARLVMRVLLVVLAAMIGLVGWAAWEMR